MSAPVDEEFVLLLERMCCPMLWRGPRCAFRGCVNVLAFGEKKYCGDCAKLVQAQGISDEDRDEMRRLGA